MRRSLFGFTVSIFRESRGRPAGADSRYARLFAALQNIDFPSDQISVATLRRLKPELFDGREAPGNTTCREQDALFQEVLDMVRAERWLARRAYEKTLAGQTIVGNDDDRAACLDELMTWYLRVGLVRADSTPHTLVRAFELQAAAAGEEPKPGSVAVQGERW